MKKLFLVVLILITVVAASAQTKVVTNQDLEKFRQKRVEAEKELRAKYAAMGTTPEEVERQYEEKRERSREYFARLVREQQLTQAEIIEQANALRLEIASVEAQINYLRSQTGVYDSRSPIYSYGYAPFSSGYALFGVPNYNYRAPNVRRQPRAINSPRDFNAARPNSPSIAVVARRPNSVYPRRYDGYRKNYGRRGFYRGGYIVPVIVGGSDNSGEFNAQILSLEQQRAGLLAQWSILEDRARRAGFKLN